MLPCGLFGRLRQCIHLYKIYTIDLGAPAFLGNFIESDMYIYVIFLILSRRSEPRFGVNRRTSMDGIEPYSSACPTGFAWPVLYA